MQVVLACLNSYFSGKKCFYFYFYVHVKNKNIILSISDNLNLHFFLVNIHQFCSLTVPVFLIAFN